MALRKVTQEMMLLTRQKQHPTLTQVAGVKSAFTLSAMKNFPELIPLVGILGVAVFGALGMSVYAMVQKSDVSFNRSEIPPWEMVDPEKKQKLIVFDTQYKRNPELDSLRKEIGSFRV